MIKRKECTQKLLNAYKIVMSNLTAFFGTFSAYLILFLVFALTALAAVFVGIIMRKAKNKATGVTEEKVTE